MTCRLNLVCVEIEDRLLSVRVVSQNTHCSLDRVANDLASKLTRWIELSPRTWNFRYDRKINNRKTCSQLLVKMLTSTSKTIDVPFSDKQSIINILESFFHWLIDIFYAGEEQKLRKRIQLNIEAVEN